MMRSPIRRAPIERTWPCTRGRMRRTQPGWPFRTRRRAVLRTTAGRGGRPDTTPRRQRGRVVPRSRGSAAGRAGRGRRRRTARRLSPLRVAARSRGSPGAPSPAAGAVRYDDRGGCSLRAGRARRCGCGRQGEGEDGPGADRARDLDAPPVFENDEMAYCQTIGIVLGTQLSFTCRECQSKKHPTRRDNGPLPKEVTSSRAAVLQFLKEASLKAIDHTKVKLVRSVAASE